jgi:RNA polymerase subunit RPABC4/transcription elongation factor Spt4
MPKTLVEVKRCKKCGRIPPEDSAARQCPYCGGTFEKVYVKKEGAMKIW